MLLLFLKKNVHREKGIWVMTMKLEHTMDIQVSVGKRVGVKFLQPPHHLHNAPAPHDAPTPHDARKGRHYYIRLLLAFARTSPQDERSETSFVYSSDAPCGRHGGRGIMGGVSII